ncbi:MAG: hypothetical protein WC436_02015 [Candidatus Babeliales bacterium]
MFNQSQDKTIFLFGDFHDLDINVERENTNLNFLKELIHKKISQNTNYNFYMLFEGPSEIKSDFFSELTVNNNSRLLNKIPNLIAELNKNSELIKLENINFRKISFLAYSLFLAYTTPQIYAYNPEFIRHNHQAYNLCELKFKELFDEFRENFGIIHEKMSFLNNSYLENLFTQINSNFQDLINYLNSQNIIEQNFLLKIAVNMYLDNIEKFVTENICDQDVLLEVQEQIRLLKIDFNDFIANYLSKSSDWSSLKNRIEALSNCYFGEVQRLAERNKQDFIDLLASFNENRNIIERKIAACFNPLIDLNILQNILNAKNNSEIFVVAGASHTKAVKEFLLNLYQFREIKL